MSFGKVKNYLKSSVITYFTKRIAREASLKASNPLKAQKNTFEYLLKHAADTRFGLDHDFNSIRTYQDWVQHVPVRNYEGLKLYLDEVISGKENILWPGCPISFATTSGTTSGSKYIPITREFLKDYTRAGRNFISIYIAETGNTSCLMGKILIFTHNVVLEKLNGIPVKTIGAIAHNYTPKRIRRKFLPKVSTTSVEDFSKRLELYITDTIDQDIRMIRGVPPIIQSYFNGIVEYADKPIKKIFPNLSLIVHGSVNIQPYRSNLEHTIGKKIDTIEAYPSSEGFIAFQDSQTEPGLLLNVDCNIFYEFIPANEYHSETQRRISLKDVELDVNYVIILNTNAGLWGYELGDTVRFVSINPYRIKVTGRTSHFLSTSGEHLISEDVEGALTKTAFKMDVDITEFTVAPQIDKTSYLPYHEWYIEFDKPPEDIVQFSILLDKTLKKESFNYNVFRLEKNILPLEIKIINKGGFNDYMKSIGKWGGQNKVPRLSNDRKIANALWKYCSSKY